MYGKPNANKYESPLKVQANAGSNSVKVEKNLGWSVGDKIVITTTDHDDTHTEEH